MLSIIISSKITEWVNGEARNRYELIFTALTSYLQTKKFKYKKCIK